MSYGWIGRTFPLVVFTTRVLAAHSAMSWRTRLSGSFHTQKRATAGCGKAGCSAFMPCILGSTCLPGMAMQSISRIGGSVKVATPSSLATQSRSSLQMPGVFVVAGGVDNTICRPFLSSHERIWGVGVAGLMCGHCAYTAANDVELLESWNTLVCFMNVFALSCMMQPRANPILTTTSCNDVSLCGR